MEKFVITIGREYGSGGRGIAHRLADALGIRYYDKELIRMASEDSGISEALFNLTDEKLEDKFLRKHGISKGTLVSQPQPDRLTKEELFQFQSEIIRRVADLEESCIIIGRCADYVLKDYDNVVNIFVCGDMESKIHRMMWTFSLEKEVAEERIRETDKQRHKYYNYYTGKTWDAASNYDLCLNTGDMTIEEAAEQIKLYLKQKGLMK